MRLTMRGGRAVTVTDHALDRYIERGLAFALDRAQAWDHLCRVVAACGSVRRDPPEWQVGREAEDGRGLDRRAHEWLMVGDDIAFAVIAGEAVTCVARGAVSEVTRRKRNAGKRAVREARRQDRDRFGYGRRPARRRDRGGEMDEAA